MVYNKFLYQNGLLKMTEKYYQDGIEIPREDEKKQSWKILEEKQSWKILKEKWHQQWWRGFDNAVIIILNYLDNYEAEISFRNDLKDGILEEVDLYKKDG